MSGSTKVFELVSLRFVRVYGFVKNSFSTATNMLLSFLSLQSTLESAY